MKILITGAAGMLGSALCPTLASKRHTVISSDLIPAREENIQSLDVTKYDHVKELVENVKPEIVFHLAAETDVDKCELEPDHAYLTNSIGTQNVALLCQKWTIPMVYISTLGVFCGDNPEPYTEFDTPNPINVYGKSKLEGERIVQSLLNKYYIVRAGWMVGGGPKKDKKFVGKIMHQITERTVLRVVNDKIGSPTYTFDLSICLASLIGTGYYGLYHCTNKGYGSRFDVAKRIVDFMGRNDVTVEPVSSAYFPLPAARARSEASRNYKLDLLGMDTIRHWEAALREYLDTNWRQVGKA
jgi:dTDP-4-dehydrorhamnose reductase